MERKALDLLCSKVSLSTPGASTSQKPCKRFHKWLNSGGDAAEEAARFTEHADLLSEPLLSFSSSVPDRSSFLFKTAGGARAGSKKARCSTSKEAMETALQEEELAGMTIDRPSPLLCPLSWEANASMLHNS
eukprot:756474-Hanusia_phi.AAC.3